MRVTHHQLRRIIREELIRERKSGAVMTTIDDMTSGLQSATESARQSLEFLRRGEQYDDRPIRNQVDSLLEKIQDDIEKLSSTMQTAVVHEPIAWSRSR